MVFRTVGDGMVGASIPGGEMNDPAGSHVTKGFSDDMGRDVHVVSECIDTKVGCAVACFCEAKDFGG